MKDEPVFPNQILTTDWKEKTEWHQHYQFVGGLTKREYFAAMAMQGIVTELNPQIPHSMAEIAVLAADTLIAELSKDKGDK